MEYHALESLMTDFESLKSGTPLPTVNPQDLKGVWYFVQASTGQLDQNVVTQGVGFDARRISQHCEPGADVVAVFYRAALLRYCFQAGLFDDWRDGNEPSDRVFRVGATFPMDQGVQGFDPAAFIESLRHGEP
jgi:hypothetical protein